MRWCVLLLALLQSPGTWSQPFGRTRLPGLTDVAPMATRGLELSLTEVNSKYAINNLYRATRAYVKRAIPIGADTYDLLIKFDIKETTCLKASGMDVQGCAFKTGFFVSSASCSSRVRLTPESSQMVYVSCKQDSSSSSESSEEILGGRQQLTIPVWCGDAFGPPQGVRRGQKEAWLRSWTTGNL